MRKKRSKPRPKPQRPGEEYLEFLDRERPILDRIAKQVALLQRFQLRRVREARGLDQRDLARTCDMSQQSLSELEFRENAETISIGKLRKMARAMGFDVVYFLIPAKATSPAR